MKRKNRQIIILSAMIILTGSFASAQEKGVEKKAEKKVKIVTIDQDGNRTEKDTILKGDATFHVIESGEGYSHKTYTIVKSADSETTGSKKSIYIMKNDGDTFTITESDSMVWIGDGPEKYKGERMIVKSGTGEGNDAMVFIAKPGEKSHSFYIKTDDGDFVEKEIITGFHSEKPAEGETVIILRTSDSEEIMRIKGDAVITIKDGTVKVDNSNEKGKEVIKEEVVKAPKKK